MTVIRGRHVIVSGQNDLYDSWLGTYLFGEPGEGATVARCRMQIADEMFNASGARGDIAEICARVDSLPVEALPLAGGQ